MNKSRSRKGHADPDSSPVVLIILDMISDFDFEDGEAASRRSFPVAERIARLKTRATRAGIPTLYVNDNLGRWQSDFSDVVRYCAEPDKRGARIVEVLAPEPCDYRFLKPRHSGFYATSLDSALQHLGSRKLILTGISSHQCVLFTANDAHVRKYELMIPQDCVTAPSASEQRLAIEYFKRVLAADVRESRSIKLQRA